MAVDAKLMFLLLTALAGRSITKYAMQGVNIPLKVTSSSAIAETALQGALVFAKSARLELGDNILRTL